MALDKQQILNELGSVMNKLQSADCGCIGNIFSKGQHTNQVGNGGTTMSSLPTCSGCRRGCCHGHGYARYGHGYSAGEPCANSYMGQCNPPKLYADTYNYLNSNLMQPIVNEVYQDLKSLNGTNAVANNSLGSSILDQQQSGGGAAMQSMSPQNQMQGGMQHANMVTNQQKNYQQMGNQQMGNQQMGNQQMGNQQMGQQQMGNQQVGQMMGGMGPNIVSMMNSSATGKTGQITAPAATSQPIGQPSGDMNEGMKMNNAHYGGQQGQNLYMQQQSMSNAANPNAMGGNLQQNYGHAAPTYKVNYSNPAAQQMASHRTEQKYGQHTPGMSKFNEMFPGVMGGDLGFDPMAIAIQMNPSNQQQVAVGTMQKLMNGERIMDTKHIQPAIDGANAAVAATAASYSMPPQSQQMNPLSNLQPTQQIPQNNPNVAGRNVAELQRQAYIPQQQQQQAYTALTGAPTMNQNQPPPAQEAPQQYQQPATQQFQQQPTQQIQQPAQQQQYLQQPIQQYQQYQQSSPQEYQPTQQYQQPPAQQNYQQNSDPLCAQSVAAPNLPTMYEGKMYESKVPPQIYNAPSSPDKTAMDPIFPVETSKYQAPLNSRHQRAYEYNTLGQPVELLPAKMYHQPPPTSQQQTLSPQPVTNQPRFAVKNTVSKTALMGSKAIGRVPSRGQLQQIYNQYKGSQSQTQQSVRPAHQGATYSEGKINVTLANEGQNRQVPVERVGGDTLANNQMVYQQVPVKGQPLGHSGDVPKSVDNKPHGDMVPANEFQDKKCRNGLQDIVHSTYHTSKGPSWSFHGNNLRSPYAPTYRLRGRA